MKTRLPLLLTCLVPVSAIHAEDAFPDKLTGAWGGARSTMAEHGVSFDLDWTNYYQGLMQGTGDKSWEYGGRADAFLNIDTGKLGLWDGGLIRTHAEYYYGDLSANLGGTIAPTNLGVRLPNGDPEEVVVTSLHLVQSFGKGTNLIAGVINTVDLIAGHPFLGGGGYTRMFNLAFAAPPNGLLPPVIVGGILSVPTSPVAWTFMVYDSNDRTRGGWFDDLFDDVNVSVGGKHSFKIAGRSSSVAVTGIYSTQDGVDFNDILLQPPLVAGDKDDSWHASLQFDHFIHENAAAPGQGWGFFVKMGASDGNPNPYQAFITGGIGGQGLFATRPKDSFGLGYFYYNISDDLQDTLDPLVDFDDEQGIEAFYDFAVTPWLRVAADLQYVDPATAANDNAFVGGLRARVRF
jgi:porin